MPPLATARRATCCRALASSARAPLLAPGLTGNQAANPSAASYACTMCCIDPSCFLIAWVVGAMQQPLLARGHRERRHLRTLAGGIPGLAHTPGSAVTIGRVLPYTLPDAGKYFNLSFSCHDAGLDPAFLRLGGGADVQMLPYLIFPAVRALCCQGEMRPRTPDTCVRS